MPATNTATRYGSVAKSFHWLIALLIITMIPLGIIANGAPFETGDELARKAMLFSLHKTIGVFIFFVALARIGWAVSQPKPNPIHAGRPIEQFLAEMVHWLLYGSLVIVPLTGWIHHAATSGFAPIWWPFGQNLPFVPKSQSLADASRGLHIVFERVLAVSILLHVAGALKHAVIDKDETLSRMWFGTTNAGIKKHTATRAPLAAALAAWLAALMIGGAIGIYSGHGAQTSQITLEESTSEWQVQDGALSIEVTQFGSQVTGTFADWTADISFDQDAASDSKGHVRTVIAIPSLTLGSVTEQAMAPDFFDAETYPTAVFDAEIKAAADEIYIAEGTLTLKDASVPITLPFTLDIDDDTATMAGQLTLQRLDFGIGRNMPDESSLGFAVSVEISLTAQRGDE